jgi:hypothetical protein
MVRGIIIAMACVMMILMALEKKVEPHGQSPWHPLHAPVGRHPGQRPCLHAEVRFGTQAWPSAAGGK